MAAHRVIKGRPRLLKATERPVWTHKRSERLLKITEQAMYGITHLRNASVYVYT